MAWIYLIFAGVAEIGWPLGFKLSSLSQKDLPSVLWIAFAAFSMAVSGFFLYLAQRHIPIGTAYIVWTGIGGIGTFFVGIWFFGDPSSLVKYLGVLLVLSGLAVLKFS